MAHVAGHALAKGDVADARLEVAPSVIDVHGSPASIRGRANGIASQRCHLEVRYQHQRRPRRRAFAGARERPGTRVRPWPVSDSGAEAGWRPAPQRERPVHRGGPTTPVYSTSNSPPPSSTIST